MALSRTLIGRCLLITGLAWLLVAAALAAKPAQGAMTDRKMASARQMVDRINAFRARHGQRRVRFSPSLTRSSYRHSRRMVRHGFGHSSQIKAPRRFSPLGEVISAHRGWRPQIGRTVRSWARSGSHRYVLLHPSFRFVGGAPARGRLGRRPSTTWTVQLGGRR